MDQTRELTADRLCTRCDPERLGFETTAELEPLADSFGQDRAVDALRFGVEIQHDGYNLFAMGPVGAGKHAAVRQSLAERAATEPVPPDLCYLHNFADPSRPRMLQLPPGRGRELKAEMERLVEDLRSAIPAAFETDEYRGRREQIESEYGEKDERELEQLKARAKERGLALLRTPFGLALAPLRGDEVLEPAAFHALPEAEREKIQGSIVEFQDEVERFIHQTPRRRREMQQALRELNRSVTQSAVSGLVEDLEKRFPTPEVQRYLRDVRQDLIENADDFREPEEAQPTAAAQAEAPPPARKLGRYRINVLVDHADAQGAPVVYEDNPTHENLTGRIEHLSHLGALVTDFTLIKSGALHRANGGYLILDAARVLVQPFAWESLKRALRSRTIRIESLGQVLSLVSTVSLEPEPIELRVKVALIGDRTLYYLLHQLDPEFDKLFKVAADFEDSIDRSEQSQRLHARLIATLSAEERLLPFDRAAVARTIEESARGAADAEKLSVHRQRLGDLLREADHWARTRNAGTVAAADVQRAIDERDHRADRLRQRLYEEIHRGTILVDTSGQQVGQLNGLSVLQLGGFAFGAPTRITARVRIGRGDVVDIMRETETGGPIHSKGVLILFGFLAGRYALGVPLSLSASLVFEQSYGMVEGDSASLAELFGLMSALADVPLRQSIAVTGSVNQHGRVQPIGGVNEKVEGFFEVCRARGLDGRHGVVIPASNVKHLMLRREVVDAVSAGQFHVWAVETADQGIEVLTGVPAGAADAEGRFPDGSVNQRIERRLLEFAERARAFRARTGSEEHG